MERDTGIRVVPLVTVKEVLQFLQSVKADAATIAAMQDYQARYGVKS
jgi:orotate phosphoribosyltransferase